MLACLVFLPDAIDNWFGVPEKYEVLASIAWWAVNREQRSIGNPCNGIWSLGSLGNLVIYKSAHGITVDFLAEVTNFAPGPVPCPWTSTMTYLPMY